MHTTTCVQQSYVITLWVQRRSVWISLVTQHLPFHMITSAFLGALGLLQSEIESLQGIFLLGDSMFFSIRHLASPQYVIKDFLLRKQYCLVLADHCLTQSTLENLEAVDLDILFCRWLYLFLSFLVFLVLLSESVYVRTVGS